MLPLLLCFALQNTIRKVCENQQELEWNIQLLVCAVDVNLLDANTNIMRENTVTYEEFHLEVCAGRKGKLSMCSCLITRVHDRI